MLTYTFEPDRTSGVLYAGYQYDYGQQITISGLTGLPAAPQVHFATSLNASSAERRTGTYSAGSVVSAIPDTIMQSRVWYAWVYVATADSGTTMYSVNVVMTERPEASDTVTPAETSIIDGLIADYGTLKTEFEGLNSTAAASASAAAQSENNAAGYANAASAAASAALNAKVVSFNSIAEMEAATKTAGTLYYAPYNEA